MRRLSPQRRALSSLYPHPDTLYCTHTACSLLRTWNDHFQYKYIFLNDTPPKRYGICRIRRPDTLCSWETQTQEHLTHTQRHFIFSRNIWCNAAVIKAENNAILQQADAFQRAPIILLQIPTPPVTSKWWQVEGLCANKHIFQQQIYDSDAIAVWFEKL